MQDVGTMKTKVCGNCGKGLQGHRCSDCNPVKQEFNLSEKYKRYLDMWLYEEKDIKEFIKRRDDKRKISRNILMNAKLPISKRLIQNVFEDLKRDNDKLAGDKLC